VGLEAGDIGTVVHIHNGGAGYEVEIMTLAGEMVAVLTPTRMRQATKPPTGQGGSKNHDHFSGQSRLGP